jgi:hypothetical protein
VDAKLGLVHVSDYVGISVYGIIFISFEILYRKLLLMRKQGFISIIFCSVISINTFGSCHQDKPDTTNGFAALLIPAFIAALGYIAKTIYGAIIDAKKRKRALLEEKLKNFYWPILTRLEENESIWRLILAKRKDSQIDKSIADYTENDIILKNHREIMNIIIKYRYLAKFDDALSIHLREYFRHVAIYEGILKSKASIFPGEIGAPYPVDFDKIIKESTESLQKQLDEFRII